MQGAGFGAEIVAITATAGQDRRVFETLHRAAEIGLWTLYAFVVGWFNLYSRSVA